MLSPVSGSTCAYGAPTRVSFVRLLGRSLSFGLIVSPVVRRRHPRPVSCTRCGGPPGGGPPRPRVSGASRRLPQGLGRDAVVGLRLCEVVVRDGIQIRPAGDAALDEVRAAPAARTR